MPAILRFAGKGLRHAKTDRTGDAFTKGEEGEADLYSFAAITDEPPPKVSAAGHDRCIVPIRRENVDAWLHPDPKNLPALDAILEDRSRPYYEHGLAA